MPSRSRDIKAVISPAEPALLVKQANKEKDEADLLRNGRETRSFDERRGAFFEGQTDVAVRQTSMLQ